ncbi:MAG: hypothetical protein KJ571_11535 [Bacteroidetes bacterium]|nr:hypothetical protein [Bacteroidota bacterium]
MSRVERTLSIISSIVTIGNFVLALTNIVDIKIFDDSLYLLPNLSIVLKIIITIIFELSLAYVFAKLFSVVAKFNNEAIIFVLGFVVGLVSAMASIFNLEIILLGQNIYLNGTLTNILKYLMLIVFFATLRIVVILAIFESDNYSRNTSVYIQIICYIIIIISLFFQNS